jgi:hypothetical protein
MGFIVKLDNLISVIKLDYKTHGFKLVVVKYHTSGSSKRKEFSNFAIKFKS